MGEALVGDLQHCVHSTAELGKPAPDVVHLGASVQLVGPPQQDQLRLVDYWDVLQAAGALCKGHIEAAVVTCGDAEAV